MPHSNSSDAGSEVNNVIFGEGLNELGGDVVFAPVDPSGAPGTLNRQILAKLWLDPAIMPAAPALRRGYAIVKHKLGLICFVVSVGRGETLDILHRNLSAALKDPRLADAQSLWLPLMGTGYGRAPAAASRDITLAALRETGWLDRSTRIILAGPAGATPDEGGFLAPGSAFPEAEGMSEGSSTPARQSAAPQDNAETEEDADPGDDDESPTQERLQSQLSAPVVAALAFAAGLREGRTAKGGALSTTLLLYGLAESQARAAPVELKAEPAAALFTGAVHSLAKGRFRDAWADYFMPSFRPSAPVDPTRRLPRRTLNLDQVLDQAITIATAASRPAVTIEDLIVSLLNYPQGGHRLALEKMGISMADLLAAFHDARLGQIGTTLLNDVASSDDRLGYHRYASAITRFLLDAASPPPLSVSIQAPWGAGKSSLMQQIRDRLDPAEVRNRFKDAFGAKPARLLLSDVLSFLNRRSERVPETTAAKDQLWTVWFNAWKYDTSEQVWAGLVDAIVGQISGRLAPAEREKFLLKLQLARIDDGVVRKKIYDRIVTIWWAQVRKWVLTGAALFAALFGAHRAIGSFGLSKDDAALYQHLQWSPYAPLILLALYLAGSYFKSRHDTRSEPASFSLAEYLKVPNYDLTLSTIHHIHEDLLRVLRSTPVHVVDGQKRPTPLVIFIDDLDRCSPCKVAAVVEGVSMFLASDDYGCMFVIGMDPQMIAAALEDAHAKVRDQLPRYERTVPLGWRFMDKFIQLPFTIPPSGADALKTYVDWISGRVEAVSPGAEPDFVPPPSPPGTLDGAPSDAAVRPSQAASDQTSPPPKSSVLDAQVTFKESQEVGRIIQEATANTAGNPREIKRLANLARLYLGLRNERRKAEAAWRSPAASQYARWIVLTLRWPDMLRWLQWGADEVTWAEPYAALELTTRRLRLLEDAAEACALAKDWTSALVLNLSVPGDSESDWATDPKLFEFFKGEAALDPDARLSAATAVGFW